MRIRYRKISRDLTLAYGRSLLQVTAIAVGVLGLGVILGTYSVIKREMRTNYNGTIPASATLELDDSISAEVLAKVRLLPGVLQAERHATILVRMQVQERWHPMLLFVIDNFDDIRTNRFNHLSGTKRPGWGEVLVEQTALGVMRSGEGNPLKVKLGSTETILQISGTVHDPSLAPAWQEQAGYGYVTIGTLRRLLPGAGFNELRILVTEHQESTEHISRISQSVAASLREWNITVHEIQIPAPGRHPHEGQVTTVMSLFILFSILILVLASILQGTVMEVVMVKEIRQIGMMKSVGATTTQIIVLYGGIVTLLSLVGCAVAIPTGTLGATLFSRQLARLLNIVIYNAQIPAWIYFVQIAAGVLTPLLAAAFPVFRGSIISVKSALSNYGTNMSGAGPSTPKWKLFAGRLNLALQLALKNVIRQRTRFAMTVALLSVSGAIYMTSENVSCAWEKNLERVYEQKTYDLDIRFELPFDSALLRSPLQKIAGINTWEYWSITPTSIADDRPLRVTHTYPDKGHGSFSIAGLPLPTRMFQPRLVAGNWLNDTLNNVIVLNQLAIAQVNHAAIGNQIRLIVNGIPTEWTIGGFTEDVGTPATAYVSQSVLNKKVQTPVNALRLSYLNRSRADAYTTYSLVEQTLLDQPVNIISAMPVWVLRNAVAAHMKIFVNTLIGLSLLIAGVGLLALISTMSVSVMERTREIGVLRAIGATPLKIQKLISIEALIVALFSLIVALPLSMALSAYVSDLVGMLSFRVPLSLVVSRAAIFQWTTLLLAGTMCASLAAARAASKMTIREALSST